VDLTLTPVPTPPRRETAAQSGKLDVETSVAGAVVYIDKVPQPNRTDQSGSLSLSLEPRLHEVQVQKNGYDQPPVQRVAIAPGGQQTVRFHLAAQPGQLELDGAPADVEVRIGGVSMGITDGSPAFVFPKPVAPGDPVLEVALGSARRSVSQHFDPGQIKRLNWNEIVPAPPPAVKPTEEQLETNDWNALGGTATLAQLQDFLKRHPNGAHHTQAESRIADLLWAQVDQTNIEAVRLFVRDNPGNPNRAKAQDIINKDAARARREEIQKQQAAQQAQEAEAKRQILAAMGRLNSAFEHKSRTGAASVWPSVPRSFFTDLRGTLSFQPDDQGISFQAADQATLGCKLVTVSVDRKNTIGTQPCTLIFRNVGGQWTITGWHPN
jgi:hypothetical protein